MEVQRNRREFLGKPLRVGTDRRPERHSALASAPEGFRAIGGLPSFTPPALATARASLVRREIAARSACANLQRCQKKTPKLD